MVSWGSQMRRHAGVFAFYCLASIAINLIASPSLAAQTATLRVSIEGGASNSKFKFSDASKGCPKYHESSLSKEYLGAVIASDEGASMELPVGQPIHVRYHAIGDHIIGVGPGVGIKAMRTRALQVLLISDAEIRITGFEDKVPIWETEGAVEAKPATACEELVSPE